MDFGQILDEWNRRSPAMPGAVSDKDSDAVYSNKRNAAAARRRRLLKKRPDAVIDLHELTQAEAWTALDSFFNRGREQGCEKLQIIHGKGSHEGSDGVLRDVTRKFIEACPFAGESGYSFRGNGGTGATWVLIKKTPENDALEKLAFAVNDAPPA